MKIIKCARCKVERPYYEFPDYELKTEYHLCNKCTRQIYYEQRLMQEMKRNE